MRYQRGGEAKYWIPKPGEVRGEMSANTPLLNANGGPSGALDPTPKYNHGSTDETALDDDDESLYQKARELEFGDWNVSLADLFTNHITNFHSSILSSPRMSRQGKLALYTTQCISIEYWSMAPG